MTKYLQAKYEALVLNDIPLPTDVKVNKYVTNHLDEFTQKELDDTTAVFKSLETGLRQGTIFPKDLHRALTMLGLNPTDQARGVLPLILKKHKRFYPSLTI